MNSNHGPSARVLPDARAVTGYSIPEQAPVKKLFLHVSFPFARQDASYEKVAGTVSILANCIAGTCEERRVNPSRKVT